MAAALRRVTVVALAGLAGPASGILELPVSVCWSLEDRQFDLADRGQVRRAYKFVIDAAQCADHLVPYLNAALLKDVWRDLGLPPRKRAAWETLNPELQSRPAAFNDAMEARIQRERRQCGLWQEAQADPAKVARMMAHIDVQAAITPSPEKGTPDEVHD